MYEFSLSPVVRRFLRAEDGADLIEYALLVGLLALGCYAVLSQYIGGVGGLLDIIITRMAQVPW